MTTALYRRYRPENFAEVIGQEHVTEPLMQALRTGRINHAYLFSGPRGCGKTTSARILARCLNCEQGPTAVPCGVCPSCRELARGGPGSLDVVEIDAASHGGVDDARDLRERATFAPARDRFKIFILDEAHMVTPQGFNALLKIVEEPPEHVMFIFATTEPDKVIGTIRSRTHHYPFRLVPPDILTGYLEQLCTAEGAHVGAGVLPLVVRAGAGSVRDSLSVLDQLVAGADEAGIDYERAVALLGYTHAALLDDVVGAVAAHDGGSAFRVVDRVISTGHEPRRFVEDLLERLRDLIVIAASGESAKAALRDVPADQFALMRAQADHLGAAELSRAADLVNAALSEMTGATSPRLHLELLIARLLLPAADDGAAGYAARLDRLERQDRQPRAAVAALPAPAEERAAVAVAPATPAVPTRAAPTRSVPTRDDVMPGASAPGAPMRDDAMPDDAQPAGVVQAPPVAEPASVVPATPAPATAAPATPPAPAPAQAPAPVAVVQAPRVADAVPTVTRAPAEPPAPAAGVETEVLRRRWDEVLATLNRLKKATWALVSQNAHVGELTSTTLTLTFTSPGLATAFRSGVHAEMVQRAVRETLGFDVRVEGVLAEAGAAAPGPTASSTRPADAPAPTSSTRSPQVADRARAEASWSDVEPPDDIEAVEPARDDARTVSARESGQHAHAAALRAAAARPAAVEDSPEPDDPDIATSNLSGPRLVAQMLGGTVIEEQVGDAV
ncbi:DNA polymerase III subunit gamma and tau [Pengzhenrongella frigida]|uniref:DNA polymerase III subunit gamma/tau n=1 Tax=Pengzhenrongella frigida TaxID=1259133 RepID=A0A4Q5MY76_9MICO|nr:DNA polymerase III subunit gamma and tau [Cellulomonas sp. HLT2-17]RYV50610.1 DNA polymerase III subunit gamma and tau [Cellulomonas sp. HLT2-17]